MSFDSYNSSEAHFIIFSFIRYCSVNMMLARSPYALCNLSKSVSPNPCTNSSLFKRPCVRLNLLRRRFADNGWWKLQMITCKYHFFAFKHGSPTRYFQSLCCFVDDRNIKFHILKTKCFVMIFVCSTFKCRPSTPDKVEQITEACFNTSLTAFSCRCFCSLLKRRNSLQNRIQRFFSNSEFPTVEFDGVLLSSMLPVSKASY